jgi:hypothetical protein
MASTRFHARITERHQLERAYAAFEEETAPRTALRVEEVSQSCFACCCDAFARLVFRLVSQHGSK